jgi:hypothetical protein
MSDIVVNFVGMMVVVDNLDRVRRVAQMCMRERRAVGATEKNGDRNHQVDKETPHLRKPVARFRHVCNFRTPRTAAPK